MQIKHDTGVHQARVLELGKRLMEESKESNSLFSKKGWYGRVMDWSMSNEAFKTRMFHFIDVLPCLQSPQAVAQHLKEYFADEKGQLPSIFSMGLNLGGLMPSMLAKVIRSQVASMAKMFITGESPQAILPILHAQRKKNVAATVDLLGEVTLSEEEALRYQVRYLELLDILSQEPWRDNPLLDVDKDGQAMPQVNVSVKLSSLYSQIELAAWQHTKKQLKDRLRPIFASALEKKAFINVDTEHYDYKDLTFQVVTELLEEKAFRSYPHFGIVLQAYLRDARDDLGNLLALARRRDCPFTIRLVKGAYWDYETVHAAQNDWPIPVFTQKAESDVMFERCCYFALKHPAHLRLAVGSHNVRSIAAAVVMAEDLGLHPKAVEFQMLYGMTEALKGTMAARGHTVREYSTVGELIPGMAYLVRRLLENTSNESFLRGRFADGKSMESLLEDPATNMRPSSPTPPKRAGVFYNARLLDFKQATHRQAYEQALEEGRQNFGTQVLPMIGGESLRCDNFYERYNPSHKTQLLAKVGLGTPRMAEQAIEQAQAAWPAWSQLSHDQRATYLDKTADILEKNRFRLAALMTHESAKPWREADADVCEGIDFCRYYARGARALSAPRQVGGVPGEKSLYAYQARGVAAVIAPWNFPLAILTGMAAAALVMGNTVIMKPAEQSSLIGLEVMRAFLEAGVPPQVLHFLCGEGEVVGEALTAHPAVALIAFTGSKEVGLRILRRAQTPPKGMQTVKRCVVEMGGKNAIIVDEDADLDEAVAGVLYSAFGFQGQKCSACSRVIVLEKIYASFKDRLVAAAAGLHVGPAHCPQSYLGPVIDSDAQAKILHFIEEGKAQHRLLFEAHVEAAHTGYYVPHCVFEAVNRDAKMATEEIFGPVLALFKASDLDDALALANSSSFGLTGAVFTRSPAVMEKVKRQFHVGNLYINRGCTGAAVDRHPFGGVKLSGIGSKTGGPDYLLQFADPKTIVENTFRRGFEAED